MMTLTKKPNLYPGMIDSSIEFFTVEGEAKMMTNGKISSFTELPFVIIELLRDVVNKDPQLKMALLDWHPNSEYKRLEQLIKCRFGGLDFTADIQNNTLQEGEYWECPVRSSCVHNGTVCQAPKYNEFTISETEIQIIQLTATDQINEVIASELHLPFGTFHKIKQTVYSKFKVQTKQELTLIARLLNFI